MKHSIRITVLLLVMFFITQLIGIAVIRAYQPEIKSVVASNGTAVNETVYSLPYSMNPPTDATPQSSLFSIIIAIAVAVVLMLLLMRLKAETFLRLWFFFVVALAIGITINSLFLGIKYSSILALIISVPLALLKIFKRNIIVHNITELAIYPGIAAIITPLLNIWSVVILLILISLYDIYAVWHAGFMQKMAKYQIQKLRLFSGFFIPYMGKKDREMMKNTSKRKLNAKKVKVSVAILGGGDVVFPIILAGVVLAKFGILSAIIIAAGATFALAGLFYLSEKGKFYPAMPFISAGCFAALIVVYLINLL